MHKVLLALIFWGSLLPPEGPELRVLPWNGFKGAVSLTFDDGDPSQNDVALPELDRRKMRATFFLISSRIGNAESWKKASAAGHEIGSHSANHKNPAQFKPDEEEGEVVQAAKSLEQTFGRPIPSFAYPFSAVTPGLRSRVEKVHLLARGGGGNPIPLEPEPDWLNLPSQATMTEGKLETYQGWIDAALLKASWSIFMIHGLEGTPWGYSPIRKATFVGILDHLKEKELWVAPFGEVGAYWKAQKILEKIKGTTAAGGLKWEWKVPPLFPKGVVLKMKIDPAKQDLRQRESALKPDAKGICSLKFDEGALALRSPH